MNITKILQCGRARSENKYFRFHSDSVCHTYTSLQIHQQCCPKPTPTYSDPPVNYTLCSGSFKKSFLQNMVRKWIVVLSSTCNRFAMWNIMIVQSSRMTWHTSREIRIAAGFNNTCHVISWGEAVASRRHHGHQQHAHPWRVNPLQQHIQ